MVDGRGERERISNKKETETELVVGERTGSERIDSRRERMGHS